MKKERVGNSSLQRMPANKHQRNSSAKISKSECVCGQRERWMKRETQRNTARQR